ncbi:beta-N-acetylglucosaminidase domain-containing protein [Brachybacterium halotolerans subsp. kimchii]|uniref:beta-N-acetylglucosaminidase domain-containing protein n=1 Tax=Brachybacterium halotolerans TaxID=2795215 RepID=UPI001E2C3B77|nr:beta-N-acetylglucosaminidase domain-containing protein [Brachybacterium halotolerans]UEJ81303.1 beta-N-acetylglucosaminidase domain-containing protein [Brachybacterium halotolerans subsp. kimchii]
MNPLTPDERPTSTRHAAASRSDLTRRRALGLAAAAGGGVVAASAAAPALAAGTAAGAGAAGGTPAPASPAKELPPVHPVPQKVTVFDGNVSLAGKVSVIVGKDTDDAALAALREVLEDAGASVSLITATSEKTTAQGTRIHLGTAEDNPTIAPSLKALGAKTADGLEAEGHVLAAGRSKGALVVLAGRDAAGSFYAVQTLRRLLDGTSRLRQVEVRDWPLMPIRGSIEGFYGIPWSHRARLDHFPFYGRRKLNTYIYTPKDDLLLRSKWRDLYEGEALEDMAELVETATKNHVHFTYALSPGNDITYGSDDDFAATVKKFDQVRDLGVTSFYIALDDIPTELNEEDAAQFDSLAAAQAHYLNRLQDEYVKANDLEPLQTVPTEYWGSGPSDYKTAFGTGIDPDIRVQWTGEGVFSPQVTVDSASKAEESYHSEHLYVWDNFPVNDGRRDRIFLNPLEGRADTLHEHFDGFTSNPMIEPYASLPALANYADYCWNPPAYEAEGSFADALDELAGDDRQVRRALDVFVDLNVNWPYRDGSPKAPALSADVEAYRKAYEAGSPGGRQDLRTRLNRITKLPRTLEAMASQGFVDDTRPWMTAASQWAQGLTEQDRMLTALEDGALKKASKAAASAKASLRAATAATVPDQGDDGVYREDQITPSVGDGVFEVFIAWAWAQLRDVMPDDPSLPFVGLPATASTTLDQYQDHAPALMVDGDESTMFWSSRAPKKDDTITLELSNPSDLRFVQLKMAKSDETAGDQVYKGVVESSADGEEWSTIGTLTGDPVFTKELGAGVRASHVRVRVTGKNPGGKWVQVREFAVSDKVPSGN